MSVHPFPWDELPLLFLYYIGFGLCCQEICGQEECPSNYRTFGITPALLYYAATPNNRQTRFIDKGWVLIITGPQVELFGRNELERLDMQKKDIE
jgi:hypothetical protein